MPLRKCLLACLATIVTLFAMNFAHATKLASCTKADSHAAERQCLERLGQRSAAELAQTEAKAEARLNTWDEDADYKTLAQYRLRQANQSFRRYLAQQCSYEQALSAGGNGAGDMQLSCEIDLRRQRSKQLQSLSKSLPAATK